MSQYCMHIQWDGKAFSVNFPEFPGYQTQGTSWQDAAKNGEALLAQILESGEQPATQNNIDEQLEAIYREIEGVEEILQGISWQDTAWNSETFLTPILESREQPAKQSNISTQLEAMYREIEELEGMLQGTC